MTKTNPPVRTRPRANNVSADKPAPAPTHATKTALKPSAPAPTNKVVRAKNKRKTDAPAAENGSEFDALLTDASKIHGAQVIRRADTMPAFKHLPTNIFTLDIALHGGIIEGAITLVYGWEACGKTTLAMRLIAAAQAKHPEGKAVFVDVEGTYDPTWGAAHGVDNTRMYLIQPDTGEQAVDLARAALSASDVVIVVVDSLAALSPQVELDKSAEDPTVGLQGKLIARFCRVLQSVSLTERKRGHRPSVVLINQWRQKIGVMFGDTRTLPGGVAQHYAASTKIEMKNIEVMGKDELGRPIVDHNVHNFNLKKSKAGTGIRSGEFKLVRNPAFWGGAGFIDEASTVVSWCRSVGKITGGGSSWRIVSLPDEKFGRLSDIADFLYANDNFYSALKEELIKDYREFCGLSREYL